MSLLANTPHGAENGRNVAPHPPGKRTENRLCEFNSKCDQIFLIMVMTRPQRQDVNFPAPLTDVHRVEDIGCVQNHSLIRLELRRALVR